MLHVPNQNTGSSRYCGPTAIMAVTGEPGSVVRDAIRQARGNIMTASGHHMPVAGLSNHDLLETMKLLGWHVAAAWREGDSRFVFDDGSRIFKRPSGFKPCKFSEFLAEHGDRGPFVVNVTGHYAAVSGGEVCEAYETPLPIDIERFLTKGHRRYRHAWVRRWWSFARATQPTAARTGLAQTRKRRPEVAKTKERARNIPSSQPA